MAQTTLDIQENPEWVLMAKALRGELSEKEQQEFTAWLNADDSHPQQWADALEVWDEVGAEQSIAFEPDTELAWAKLCTKIDLSEAATPVLALVPEPEIPEAPAAPQEPVVRPLFAWNSLYKYAAAFVLAAGLAWVGYLQLNPSAEWAQVATTTGERKMFYLPDSSQVTLNGNSTLRYQTAFTGTERKVELTGEGFFDVRKNPQKPFVVVSGKAQTKVLGTSFNVKAIAGEQKVSVAVRTGKVSFSALGEENQLLLTPGFTGELAANGQLIKKTTDDSGAPAWRKLEFNGQTLQQVAGQLEAYFTVDIEIPNQKLQKCTFTGTFEQPQLKEILTVLAASSDFNFSKKNNQTYLFEGVGCQ